jgi:hypothetical protein
MAKILVAMSGGESHFIPSGSAKDWEYQQESRCMSLLLNQRGTLSW